MEAILLVEDSVEWQLVVQRTLGASFRVVVASHVEAARAALARESFQLILLDVGLPDADGFEFCSELQADPRTRGVPVLFLTANSDIAAKVTAFSVGAEDYIVKPFHPLELRARIEARFKRNRKSAENAGSFWKGCLHFEVAGQRVSIAEQGGERDLHLTPREFRLLYLLAQNEEQVLSRRQILSAVWGDAEQVSDRAVDTHISSIRKKLGVAADYLSSVLGRGYRMAVPLK